MGEALKQRLKQSSFENDAQEALLNVLVAANYLRQHMSHVCAALGITHAQYNVLRILRGVYPSGHPRSDIICRMIEQAPDVTRLIDRLEKQGLVERVRIESDRRLSIARITTEGLDLLARVQPDIDNFDKSLKDKLSEEECRVLSALCEKIYTGKE